MSELDPKCTETCENYKPITTEQTMEKLLTRQELYEAMGKGQDVQIRGHSGKWDDFPYNATEITISDECEYRRKPAKKVVPWTFETAPKCGEVITFDNTEKLITERSEHGLVFGATDVIRLYGDLLGNKRYQFHGKPCGVEVEG